MGGQAGNRPMRRTKLPRAWVLAERMKLLGSAVKAGRAGGGCEVELDCRSIPSAAVGVDAASGRPLSWFTMLPTWERASWTRRASRSSEEPWRTSGSTSVLTRLACGASPAPARGLSGPAPSSEKGRLGAFSGKCGKDPRLEESVEGFSCLMSSDVGQ